MQTWANLSNLISFTVPLDCKSTLCPDKLQLQRRHGTLWLTLHQGWDGRLYVWMRRRLRTLQGTQLSSWSSSLRPQWWLHSFAQMMSLKHNWVNRVNPVILRRISYLPFWKLKEGGFSLDSFPVTFSIFFQNSDQKMHVLVISFEACLFGSKTATHLCFLTIFFGCS